jgi:hypothetical protein
VAAIASNYIVNPENKFPTIHGEKGAHIQYSYFESDIANNVPKLLQIIALVELGILIFALINVWIPNYELNEEDDIKMPWNVEPDFGGKMKAVLRSNQFVMSYIMMFMAVLFI